MPRSTYTAAAWSVLLLVLALVLQLGNTLQRFDLVLYDWYQGIFARPASNDIVIVAIDQHSIEQLGRWPWSRSMHARLVRRLTAAGARAIAFQISFSEHEANSPQADADFAAALAESARVVLPVVNEQSRLGGQPLETTAVPLLARGAAAFGHVDVELDADGIARAVSLRAGLGSPSWPTLPLAVLQLASEDAPLLLPGERRTNGPEQSPYTWQRDHRILIPFAGPPGHFAHLSYADVLDGDFLPAAVKAKFVLVGVTASGLADTLPSPVSGLSRPMPGVEFSANVLDTLRRGLSIEPLAPALALSLTALLVLLPMLAYAASPLRGALPVVGLSLLLTTLTTLLLVYLAHRWFAPAVTLFVQAISYPLWSWLRLRQALRSLHEQEEQALVALRSIADGVITTDARGAVQYANPVAEELLGAGIEAMRGKHLGAVFRVADDRQRYTAVNLVASCLETQKLIRLPEGGLVRGLDGSEHAVRASVAPIHDAQKRLAGVVVAISDLSETRRLNEQMLHQATHDGLTGLPNLCMLRDRLKQAIARARRNGSSFALLFVDLDHFKKVNEGLGHTAGDAVLRAVAERLRGCGRRDDTIVRIGGDEFGCVLENVYQEERVVDFVRKLQDILERPFEVSKHECFVTASIGICLYPKDGHDVESLLRHGDTAMARAKENGPNSLQFYAQDMHQRSLERLMLERDLRHAIARGELELYYQPQMDLRQRRIVGVEALLRWRHPDRGLISPLDFVPLAEETGLIETIGEWVLATACRQVKDWQERGFDTLRVAVNLSPRQFQHPNLAKVVAGVLNHSGLDAACLDLEITESVLMKDMPSSIATMHALKEVGVRLSIDDFGTGFSSLNYLKEFPIGQLKIDRSFLHELGTGKDDAAITLAIIAMAHSMSLTVIAEGVENESQEEFLLAHHCDEMQGYRLSRPLPAAEIPALLACCPLADDRAPASAA